MYQRHRKINRAILKRNQRSLRTLKLNRSLFKFKFWVDWVQFDTENQKFAVTISDLTDEKHHKTTEFFDYVIVGNGRYNKPNYVTFTGEETFPGKILHAKYFHDPKRFAGYNHYRYQSFSLSLR